MVDNDGLTDGERQELAVSAEDLGRFLEKHERTTPVSNFRIPPDLKAKAKEKAESEGRTLTDVVVTYLKQYTRGM
jgi:LDH2 family malate/lactate/ureidoglycolate dehydrogenase